jgi:hypothetical protein
MEMDRANISMDRALEIMKEAYKAEVERALEAQKVAYKAEMDDSVVAENALQRKVWDSGRTHPDISITNSQLTIKRELNTTHYAVATISCLLTESRMVTLRVRVDTIASNSWMCIGVRHPQEALDSFLPLSSEMSKCTYYLSFGIININKNMVTILILPFVII